MRKNIAIAACAALLAALAYFILNPTARPYAPISTATPCTPCAPCGASNYVPQCAPFYTAIPAPVTYAVPPTTAPVYPDYNQQADPSKVSLPLPDDVNEVALSDAIKDNIARQQNVFAQNARVVLVTSDDDKYSLLARYTQQLSETNWATTYSRNTDTYPTSSATFYKQGVALRVVVARVADWQNVSDSFVTNKYSSDVYKLIAGKKTVMLVIKGTSL